MVEESLRALHSGPRGQQQQWHRRPGGHRWRGRRRRHGTVLKRFVGRRSSAPVPFP